MEILDEDFDRGLSVGEAVDYLPHTCHAFTCNRLGEFPYVVGERSGEAIREIPPDELQTRIVNSRKSPRRVKEKKMSSLLLLRLNAPWHAVVRGVNDDGTVDLDIASNRSGVTLHYNRVRVTEEDVPHTCRRKR